MAIVDINLLDSNTVIDPTTPGVVDGEATTLNIVSVSALGEHTLTVSGLPDGVTITQAAGLNIASTLNVTAENGSVVTMPGGIIDASLLSGATFTVSDSSTIALGQTTIDLGVLDSSPTVAFTGDGSGTFVWGGSTVGVGATDIFVTGFGTGDRLDIANGDVPSFTDLGNGEATLTFANGFLNLAPVTFHISGMDPAVAATIAANPSAYLSSDGLTAPVCFVSGTRILTARGEVAVEDLQVGDLAVTASGEERPIIWIGQRRIERPAPEAQPVRIMAGAFGENLPVRDLFLSPGHAVCVDMAGEVFTPVSKLVNGTTIARVEVPEVTYWHVELESHDVLIAEGMPSESYMDAGNRAYFGRRYGRLDKIDPARVAESLTRYARPFVDGGLIVEAIRERLVARAEAMGAEATSAQQRRAAA